MAASDTRPPQITPSPSPLEAAAIVAALEQFRRATAPAATPDDTAVDLWQRAAIVEGVSREPWADVPDPWINT